MSAADEAPRVETETEEKCENCGKPMVLRWGRFGQFYACTGYPECKTTKPYGDEATQPEATDEKCDECESPMVVKRGRFGPFLACSRYPECKGSRPILKKIGVECPKDQGEIVEKRSKRGRTAYVGVVVDMQVIDERFATRLVGEVGRARSSQPFREAAKQKAAFVLHEALIE